MESRRHLNVRGKSATLPAITDKDWLDLKFGVEAGVDFYALSFVQVGGGVRRGMREGREGGREGGAREGEQRQGRSGVPRQSGARRVLIALPLPPHPPIPHHSPRAPLPPPPFAHRTPR